MGGVSGDCDCLFISIKHEIELHRIETLVSDES